MPSMVSMPIPMTSAVATNMMTSAALGGGADLSVPIDIPVQS